MPLIEINKNPTARNLRWFGILLPVFVALLATVLWWRSGRVDLPVALACAGGALALVYGTFPASRRPIFLGAMYTAWPIGTVTSMVLLGLVYFGLVTPIGIVVRLIHRDPLRRAFDSGPGTFWVRRPPRPPVDRYFRQF